MHSLRKGFGGVVHIMIGLVISSLLLLLSILANSGFLELVSRDIFWTLLLFFTIIGGSLFPDLDSSRSTAEFRLGMWGRILASFMRGTSEVVWRFYHGPRDLRLSRMHRAIYHTPFILFSMFLLFYFGIKDDVNGYLLEYILELRVKDLPVFLVLHFPLFLSLVLSYLFVRLAMSTLLYKPFKKAFRKQHISELVTTILSSLLVLYLMNNSISDIRNFSFFIVLGYFSHLFGDLLSKGSIPLFFPLMVKKQAYFRPKLFFQMPTDDKTSSIVSKVCLVLSFALIASSVLVLMIKMDI